MALLFLSFDKGTVKHAYKHGLNSPEIAPLF